MNGEGLKWLDGLIIALGTTLVVYLGTALLLYHLGISLWGHGIFAVIMLICFGLNRWADRRWRRKMNLRRGGK